ncbi:MAG: UDP-N-acetylmuramoyl-tripeptide--D-alanyl-D-alanine ligase [bacterium]
MSKLKQIFGSAVLIYLRILSKVQLSKIKPIIIGLTGSTGKTSLRDASKLVLEVKYKVKVSEKANSESGIPLDILGLHMNNYSIFDWIRVCLLAPVMLLINWERYDIYLVEMGVDSPRSPKNMSYLLKIVTPRVGVLLNVSAVHSEQYDYLVPNSVSGDERYEKILDLIAQEKGKLLKSLNLEGYAIGNIDDKRVQKVLSESQSHRISFGKQGDSDVRITSVNQHKDTFCTKLSIDGKNYSICLENTYLPEAYAYTFAGAMAVGYVLKVDLDKASNALSKYKIPAGRMSVFKGIKDSIIIDSSYNSSKMSVFEAFDLTEQLSNKDKSKVILALGDMREMGEETKHEHEEIAERAVKIADRMVLVGPYMKYYFLPKAISLGFIKDNIFTFEKSSEAAEFIKDILIKKGDVVLAKGSQNTIFMENVVEKLLANPRDVEKLCRREKYWDKMREEYR